MIRAILKLFPYKIYRITLFFNSILWRFACINFFIHCVGYRISIFSIKIRIGGLIIRILLLNLNLRIEVNPIIESSYPLR